MNEKYTAYLISEEWSSIKIDLLQKRGCKCEKCGKAKPPNKLQIHHKTYERIFNEIPTDLIILCARCHMIEHKDIIPKKALRSVGIETKRKLKPKKRKKKPKPTISGIIQKYKAGGFGGDKAILKEYRKAIKGRRI